MTITSFPLMEALYTNNDYHHQLYCSLFSPLIHTSNSTVVMAAGGLELNDVRGSPGVASLAWMLKALMASRRREELGIVQETWKVKEPLFSSQERSHVKLMGTGLSTGGRKREKMLKIEIQKND